MIFLDARSIFYDVAVLAFLFTVKTEVLLERYFGKISQFKINSAENLVRTYCMNKKKLMRFKPLKCYVSNIVTPCAKRLKINTISGIATFRFTTIWNTNTTFMSRRNDITKIRGLQHDI